MYTNIKAVIFKSNRYGVDTWFIREGYINPQEIYYVYKAFSLMVDNNCEGFQEFIDDYCRETQTEMLSTEDDNALWFDVIRNNTLKSLEIVARYDFDKL